MADQYQQTKESAGQKMDQTAQYGQEKTGQAHDQAKVRCCDNRALSSLGTHDSLN